MATLLLDQPLRTREPVVDVDGGLPLGTYLVRLVVEGANGRSEPAELTVRVVRALEPRPTDPLRPLDPLRPRDPINPLDPFRPT